MNDIPEDSILFKRDGSFTAVPTGYAAFGFSNGVPVIKSPDGSFTALAGTVDMKDDALILGDSSIATDHNYFRQGGIVLTHNNSSDPSSIQFRSSTGYARMRRWDNTSAAVSGSGSSSTVYTISLGSSSVSPYNANLDRPMALFPCDAAGSPVVGAHFLELDLQSFNGSARLGDGPTKYNLNKLRPSNGEVVIVKNLPNLVELVSPSSGTKVEVINCPNISKVNLTGFVFNQVTGISGRNLTSLNVGANAFSVNDNFPELGYAKLTSCNITSAATTGIDLTSSTELTGLLYLSCGPLQYSRAPVTNACTQILLSGPFSAEFTSRLITGNSRQLTNFTFFNPGDAAYKFKGYLSYLEFVNFPVLTEVTINDSTWLNGTIHFSGCPTLRVINLVGCQVSQITGASSLTALQNANVSTYALNLGSNNMSASALNDLFTALPTTVQSAGIRITGNPGAATCNPAIATAKGYTIIN